MTSENEPMSCYGVETPEDLEAVKAFRKALGGDHVATRIVNCMWRQGVRTLAELDGWSDDRLLDIRNFGLQALIRVRVAQDREVPSALPGLPVRVPPVRTRAKSPLSQREVCKVCCHRRCAKCRWMRNYARREDPAPRPCPQCGGDQWMRRPLPIRHISPDRCPYYEG